MRIRYYETEGRTRGRRAPRLGFSSGEISELAELEAVVSNDLLLALSGERRSGKDAALQRV
jgi:hypothetical protein